MNVIHVDWLYTALTWKDIEALIIWFPKSIEKSAHMTSIWMNNLVCVYYEASKEQFMDYETIWWYLVLYDKESVYYWRKQKQEDDADAIV